MRIVIDIKRAERPCYLYCKSPRGASNAFPLSEFTMADIDLTQSEADELIAMEKQRVDDKQWDFPGPGERLAIPLSSTDKRENFMLDITRAQVKLTKATYQNRARQVIILMLWVPEILSQ